MSNIQHFYVVIKTSVYDAVTGTDGTLRAAAITKWKETIGRGKVTRKSNDEVWGIFEQNQFEDVPDELTMVYAEEGASCWQIPTGANAVRFTHDQLTGEYGMLNIDDNWKSEPIE